MAEFASSGVGTAGLSLGIIGTSLAALNGGNGGILGNLFGGNNQQQAMYTDQLQAEIAGLKAEKYTNATALETYKLAREHDQKLSDAILNIRDELADVRVREAKLDGKIDMVAATANTGIVGLQGQLACLQNTVSQITKVGVPNTALCPGYGNVTITPATSTTTGAA